MVKFLTDGVDFFVKKTLGDREVRIRLKVILLKINYMQNKAMFWWCMLDDIRTFFEQNPEDFAE